MNVITNLQIINIDKEMHVECKEKELQYADNTVDLPRINVKHVVVVADKCFWYRLANKN